MKTAIRKGVFETNSSSVHTLVLRKEPSNRYIGEKADDKYRYTLDGKVPVILSQFGWGYEIVIGFDRKVDYLATMISEKYKWIEDKETGSFDYRPLNKVIEMTTEDPEWNDIVSVICSNLNLGSSECVELGCNYTDPADVYIDHQSFYSSIYDFLEANGGYSLSDYLFNEDIAIEISNDNSYPEDRMHCRDQNGYK